MSGGTVKVVGSFSTWVLWRADWASLACVVFVFFGSVLIRLLAVRYR